MEPDAFTIPYVLDMMVTVSALLTLFSYHQIWIKVLDLAGRNVCLQPPTWIIRLTLTRRNVCLQPHLDYIDPTATGKEVCLQVDRLENAARREVDRVMSFE